MHGTEWLIRAAEDDFDPSSLIPYEWQEKCSIAYGHVLPGHFMRIAPSGLTQIEVSLTYQSFWPDIERHFEVSYRDDHIALHPTSIYMHGRRLKRNEICVSRQNLIDEMDHRFATHYHLGRWWYQILRHQVCGAVEKWRRISSDYGMAKYALHAALAKLDDDGSLESRQARFMPMKPGVCESFLLEQIEYEYRRDVNAVRAWRSQLKRYPRLVQEAKERALHDAWILEKADPTSHMPVVITEVDDVREDAADFRL